MSVFERISKEIHEGLILYTPVKRKPFRIKSVKSDKVVFFVGEKSLIPIPRAIWNDIPTFLRGQDWVGIGARYDVAQKKTLQEFIDQHTSRGTQHSSDANYVASVLEYLKIVDVKHSKTSRIKLK